MIYGVSLDARYIFNIKIIHNFFEILIVIFLCSFIEILYWIPHQNQSILRKLKKKMRTPVVSRITFWDIIKSNILYLSVCIYFSAAEETTKINGEDNKSNIKSVLVYVRNKSSKKSVSWKQENDLVQISYFEHDETERG